MCEKTVGIQWFRKAALLERAEPRTRFDRSYHRAMTLSPRLLSSLATVVVLLGVPHIATACACIGGISTFEQVARNAAVVVVGSVIDTSPGPGQPPGTIIAYVDVEVSKVRRGKDVPQTISPGPVLGNVV
jgi:hypothetical protein